MNLLDLNDDILRIIFSPQEIGPLGCTALRYVCKKSAAYVAGIHLSPQCAYIDAAIGGHTRLYDWIRETSGQLCKGEFAAEAVHGGYLEFIQRVHRDCPGLYLDVCEDAAKYGHLHMLQWLVSVGFELPRESFEWGCATGRLDIIQWIVDGDHRHYSDAFPLAAENGHVHVLEWAYSRNYYIGGEIACRAGRGGQTHVLDWVISRNYALDPHAVASEAVACGHIGVLEWLKSHEYSYIIDYYAFHSAAHYGRLPVLKYLHYEGIVLHIETGYYAAGSRSIELIQWLISIGFTPESSWIPRAIAWDVDIKTLDALLLLGCELTTDAYGAAIIFDRLDIMNWLHTNGCPWVDEIVYTVCRCQRTDMMIWIHTHISGAIDRFASLPSTSQETITWLRHFDCIQ